MENRYDRTTLLFARTHGNPENNEIILGKEFSVCGPFLAPSQCIV